MNLLITSGGRRSYLVNYFQEALAGDGLVCVSNNNSISTAYHAADRAEILPQAFEEGYIPALLDCCRRNHIDALLTLFDVELPILAKHRALFEEIGVRLIVSSQRCVEICNDKWKSFLHLKEQGFATIASFLSLEAALEAVARGELRYPLVVKPRFGMGSMGVSIAENEEELRVFYAKVQRGIEQSFLHYESQAEAAQCVLIQEKIEGQEYGLDIINDLDGRYQNTIVKRKLAMRSGETDLAETEDNPALRALGQRLSAAMGHIANLDVDVFVKDGTYYILEMNARFGGGYPFSHVAGANLPLAIVQWVQGRTPDPALLQARPNVLAQKSIGISVIPQPEKK